MKGYLKRDDDFEERRKKLANLSDEELKNRFSKLLISIEIEKNSYKKNKI